MEGVEDWLNVERVECAGGSQSRSFVPDVQSIVEEPDVSFNGGTANREGRVEGDVAPVIVVRVDWFLTDS